MTHHNTKFTLFALLLLVSCSKHTTDDTVTYEISSAENISPISPCINQTIANATDVETSAQAYNPSSAAYLLGQKHATHLHTLNSTQQIQSHLLELHAIHSRIHSCHGQNDADAYIHGLRDYLKQQDDTLYRHI